MESDSEDKPKLFTQYTFCPRNPYAESSRERHQAQFLVHVTIPGEGNFCMAVEVTENLPKDSIIY